MKNDTTSQINSPERKRNTQDQEKIESVNLTPIRPTQKIAAHSLTAALVIKNDFFSISDENIKRFIDITDELHDLNPHGKHTPLSIARAFYGDSKGSDVKITDDMLDAVRQYIDITRMSPCTILRDDGTTIELQDNHLTDIRHTQRFLKVNGNLVDEYYTIERPSLIRQIEQEQGSDVYVTYVTMPFNWLNIKGIRNTRSNTALIYLIARTIAEKGNHLDFDDIYRAAGADTSKAKFDTRKKVETILDQHKTNTEMKSFLKDFSEVNEYGDKVTKENGVTPAAIHFTYEE